MSAAWIVTFAIQYSRCGCELLVCAILGTRMVIELEGRVTQVSGMECEPGCFWVDDDVRMSPQGCPLCNCKVRSNHKVEGGYSRRVNYIFIALLFVQYQLSILP